MADPPHIVPISITRSTCSRHRIECRDCESITLICVSTPNQSTPTAASTLGGKPIGPRDTSKRRASSATDTADDF
eukprot:scaffold10170_cov136-Isochrysis_galbana.AAC.3